MTKRQAEALALLVTLSWGAAFLFMKMGLSDLKPNSILFLRPGIAFLVTFPILLKRRRKIDGRALGHGCILGLIMTGMFLFILNGLPYTTSTNAGFLISLTVVFVPLIMIIKTHQLPERRTMYGLLLSVGGVCILTLQGGFNAVGIGDAMCIVGAFGNALLICYTNRAVKESDPLVVGILQLGAAFFFGLLVAVLTDAAAFPKEPVSIIGVVMLGVVCSGFGFVMQPVVQRHTSPVRTGLIFALEPVFTALIGTLVLREPFTLYSALGAALTVSGVVVSANKGKKTSFG